MRVALLAKSLGVAEARSLVFSPLLLDVVLMSEQAGSVSTRGSVDMTKGKLREWKNQSLMKVKVTYDMELFIPHALEHGGKEWVQVEGTGLRYRAEFMCDNLRQRPVRFCVAQDDKVQWIVSSELRELHFLCSPALSILRM